MNDGRPLLITIRPLTQPTAQAIAKASRMHSQSGQPHCAAGIAMITPAAPIIEPIDKSNSPPIISIEAATAMMPSWADTSRKLMMPGAENRPLPPATTPRR